MLSYNTSSLSTKDYPDTIRYDTIRYDTIRYDTIRYDTIRYDTIRYDTIRYDTIRYDTIRYDNFRHKWSDSDTEVIRTVLVPPRVAKFQFVGQLPKPYGTVSLVHLVTSGATE